MLKSLKLSIVCLIVLLIAGCKVETHSDDVVLQLTYYPSYSEGDGWAAASAMILSYYAFNYSESAVVNVKVGLYGGGSASVDETSALLWELGGIDSYVTGALSFRELRHEMIAGRPVMLHYGDYFSGHYLVVYGVDEYGRVYLHDPSYGTRVVLYEDLFTYNFHGVAHSWSSSIVLWD